MRKTIDLFMCTMMGAKTNYNAPVDDKNAYDGALYGENATVMVLEYFRVTL